MYRTYREIQKYGQNFNQVNRRNAKAIWEVRALSPVLQIWSVKTAIRLGKIQGILIGGNPGKRMRTSTPCLLRGLSLSRKGVSN